MPCSPAVSARSVNSKNGTCAVYKSYFHDFDNIIWSKYLPSRKYCWWNEPKPMGGAPGPVTCCMLRLKKQINKWYSWMFNKNNLVHATHRQLHVNKLTTTVSAHIVGGLVMNLKLVKTKVSSCRLVDGWLRDCDSWPYHIAEKLPTVWKTEQPSLFTCHKKQPSTFFEVNQLEPFSHMKWNQALINTHYRIPLY